MKISYPLPSGTIISGWSRLYTSSLIVHCCECERLLIYPSPALTPHTSHLLWIHSILFSYRPNSFSDSPPPPSAITGVSALQLHTLTLLNGERYSLSWGFLLSFSPTNQLCACAYLYISLYITDNPHMRWARSSSLYLIWWWECVCGFSLCNVSPWLKRCHRALSLPIPTT